jgi:hypothetical protein
MKLMAPPLACTNGSSGQVLENTMVRLYHLATVQLDLNGIMEGAHNPCVCSPDVRK